MHSDFVLDYAAVFVVAEAESGGHYEVERAPGFQPGAKGVDFDFQCLPIFPGNRERAIPPLHFADVDDLVRRCNQKISTFRSVVKCKPRGKPLFYRLSARFVCASQRRIT